MWWNVLTISIVVVALCFISIILLTIREKKFQKKIDDGDTTLLSCIENIDLNSPKENIEKINDRYAHVESCDKLQDYTLEIQEYKSYVKVLKKVGDDSNQSLYLNDLISLLQNRTDKYLSNSEINKYKDNIHYELNIDDNVSTLIKVFNDKEKKLKALVNKKFPAPQLTNDKFISAIDGWSDVFKSNSENLLMLLDKDSKYTDKYKDEITTKISLLKEVIDRLGDMEVELIINMDKNTNNIQEIQQMVWDMNDTIKQVKEYE